jgi:predicted aspartyl protease
MRRTENGTMGRFKVELEVANYEDMIRARHGQLSADQVRRTRIQGVVDSGAVRLILPKKVADALGPESIGKIGVRYADNRRARRIKAGPVWLKLQGREEMFSAIIEPKRTDALIGAVVLETLDFLIDPVAQQLRPRDPKEIVSEIE